ncbi:MAG TPA: hypothetical protein VHK86_01570 [Nitrososphaera sp.]|nr:hypothetical protein [Nitrososphaera sp.]
MDGEWTSGGGSSRSKGNRSLIDRISTQHQRDVAVEVAKGAAIGVAQGIVASAIIGAATGGLGGPAVLAARAIAGARSGLHPVLTGISAAAGGYSGLEAHRARMKAHVSSQHKKG